MGLALSAQRAASAVAVRRFETGVAGRRRGVRGERRPRLLHPMRGEEPERLQPPLAFARRRRKFGGGVTASIRPL